MIKKYWTFIVLLLSFILSYNLMCENIPDRIADIFMRNIEYTIKISHSENIGIYGFIVESDNTNFHIDKFFNDFIDSIKLKLEKLDGIDIIDTDDLNKADNEIDVYSSKGVEFREKLKRFFNEIDMDLLITGSFVFKDNELNILLKYVYKKRLIEIPVLKKRIKIDMLAEYLNRITNNITNKSYKSYIVCDNKIEFVYYNKTAKKVNLVYKFLDNSGNKSVFKPMTKDNNGYWRIKVSLKKGVYGYKFLADGYEKIDPMNKIKKDDGYAGFYSIIDVGGLSNEP